MPGILLSFDSSKKLQCDAIATATDRLCHEGLLSYKTFHHGNFSVAVVTGHPAGTSYCRTENGIELFVYGEIYPRLNDPHLNSWQGGRKWYSEFICDLYMRYNKRFVDYLNGEFCLVLLDHLKDLLVIANDRFAIRPWYVLETEHGFTLSPEVKALLPFLGRPPELDEEILAGFLAFNKIRLGNRTMIREIEVFPPASLWQVHLPSGRVEKTKYWTFHYNDSTTNAPLSQDTIDQLVVCYRTVMDRRSRVHEKRRVGISLSGGLDSRTMVAAVPLERRKSILAFTYGILESDEVQIAQRVAETAGMPQTLYKLDAQDYVACAEASVQFSDELDLFVQGCQINWLTQAREHVDVMMTGIDLDVTLGGIYLEPDVMAAKNDEDVFQLLCTKNTVFTQAELGDLLTPEFGRRAGEAPYLFVRDLIGKLNQDTPSAKYDLFINQYSMRRIIMLRYAMIRFFLETASPVYDYDLIDLILSLPVTHRAAHRAFVPFLHQLSPELEAIPYQRTLLPPSAPREFWLKSIEIERQKEKLYLDIWKASRGAVYLPYRRYYSNFDEWLRLNPGWLSLTDNLLKNQKSLLYQMEIIRKSYVENLIEQHRTGARSLRQRLICLMSAELYLRKYHSNI